MTIQMILLPVFVQVALTFALLIWMARRAPGASSAAKPRCATSRSASPPGRRQPTQVSNCYDSQFEIPLLFYVLVILALAHQQADLIFVVMAWIFVRVAARARLYPHHLEPRADALQCFRASARSCCC